MPPQPKTTQPYWQSDCGNYTVYCSDCVDVLQAIDVGSVKVILTDPPYGISHPVNYSQRGRDNLAVCNDYGERVGKKVHSNDYPMIVGDNEPFDPSLLLRLNKDTVMWGANYFSDKLPNSSGWLVWDKERPDTLDQATCELAWTNYVKGVRRFKHLWNGMMKASEHGENYHPMQKPVALAEWVLNLSWTPSGCVLDPYMGSGWVGVACVILRRPFIGIEITEEYCAVAVGRIQQQLVKTGILVTSAKQPQRLFGKRT